MELIENILEKPKKYRKKIAYLATGFIGMVIFTAWIVIAGSSVRQAVNPAGQNNDGNTADNSPALRQESLKTKVVNQEENQDENQQETETQNQTFETLLKKQPQDNSSHKIIERP